MGTVSRLPPLRRCGVCDTTAARTERDWSSLASGASCGHPCAQAQMRPLPQCLLRPCDDPARRPRVCFLPLQTNVCSRIFCRWNCTGYAFLSGFSLGEVVHDPGPVCCCVLTPRCRVASQGVQSVGPGGLLGRAERGSWPAAHWRPPELSAASTARRAFTHVPEWTLLSRMGWLPAARCPGCRAGARNTPGSPGAACFMPTPACMGAPAPRGRPELGVASRTAPPPEGHGGLSVQCLHFCPDG